MSIKPINTTSPFNLNKKISFNQAKNNSSTIANINNISNINTNIINKNNESEIENIDIENIDIGTTGNSNSIYSDTEDILINGLCTNITGLHSQINSELEYDIFCSIIEGRKLNEIIDESGQIKKIEDLITEDNYKKLSQKLNLTETEIKRRVEDIDNRLTIKDEEQKNTNERVLVTPFKDRKKLGDKIFDCKIDKIARNEYNGYDAIRLEDPDGNYNVFISGTDMGSGLSDAIADLYPILKKDSDGKLIAEILEKILTDNKLVNLGIFVGNILGVLGVLPEEVANIKKYGLLKYAERLYEGQKESNAKFLTETLELAKKNGKVIDINGYSLGGGHALTGCANLCLENSDAEKYIRSVNTYDAAVVHTELEDDGNKLIDYIANSDKTTLFVTQGDFVGTYNNSMEKLKDVTFIVPAKKIESNSLPIIPEDGLASNAINSITNNQREEFIKDYGKENESKIYDLIDFAAVFTDGKKAGTYMDAFFGETHYMDSFDASLANENGNYTTQAEFLDWKGAMNLRTHPSSTNERLSETIYNQYNGRDAILSTVEYIKNGSNMLNVRIETNSGGVGSQTSFMEK